MPALLESCGLWRGAPIILASRSHGRARLLESAGIPFEAVDSLLDERQVAGVDDLAPRAQAATLALAKARSVSLRYPSRVVVGADQTLEFEGRAFHKAPNFGRALAQLRQLSGVAHELHSAVACMRDDELLFSFVGTAEIRMRKLGEPALAAYATAMGDRLLATVGGYEIEGLGANLIESVRGDLFTVIGLPLFSLLSGFREIGLIEEGSDTK